MRKIKEDSQSWDLYASLIIIWALVFQLIRWPIFPMFIDIYYHLNVMLGFSKAGGYVTHAFWEFAPVGRAHVYPPLLHFLMLIFYKLGFSKLFIARFFSAFIYPILLFSVWYFVRKILTKRIAFFVLLMLSSSYYFYLETCNVLAFSLGLCFGIWALFFMHKKRFLSTFLFLLLSLYSHAISGWLIVFTVICFSLLDKRFRFGIKSAVFCIIGYLPFIIHQVINRNYFHFVNVKAMHYLEFNILVYLFAVFGYIVYMSRIKQYNKIYLAVLLGFIPLTFIYPQRFLSGQGLIAIVLIAAFGLDKCFRLLKERGWIVLIIFSLFYFVLPGVNVRKDSVSFKGINSLFVSMLPEIKSSVQHNARPIYSAKFIDPIIEIVKENSDDSDIIYSNFSYIAGLFSTFSERATSSGMLQEVRPLKDFDQIKHAKLIIWLKELEAGFPQELKKVIKKYSLEKIAETELVYIYNNPEAKSQVVVNKSVMPNLLVFGVLVLIVGLLVMDNIFIKNN
ncbi:MAG: hypothetical protein P9L96_03735 [Candidatus Gygaella obscura]|nr:hypothetical protein [Candidatus Gygaella obscura]